MGRAKGSITKEEAEAYGIPSIMLMDNSTETTGSGGIGGSASGTLEWALTWDAAGFTGSGWSDFNDAFGLEDMAQNNTLESWLEANDLNAYRIWSNLVNNTSVIAPPACLSE